MTDPPPPVFDFNVTPSDTTDRDLTSPAISISSVSNGLQRATNQAGGYADDHGANTAYAAKSTSGTEPGFLQYLSGQPAQFNFSPQDEQYLANSSTDPGNPPSTSLSLASFGSQPWVAPLGPYLDFAPQPIYEPTGELVNEHIEIFQDFDSPSSIRSSTSQSQAGSTARPVTSPNTPTPTNPPGTGSVFAQPSLPKSALKRRAEHDIGSSADPSSNKRQQSSETGGSKPRSVSFERMSGTNPRSPGDGSPSSDHQSGQRGSQSSATTAASRRSRPSSGSTPRATVNIPSAASQAQSRSTRSSRVPSANPPSILPKEKVFPIQIGSDLFRLSGASISSDAPSYFTQFFEEQLRQNEESGGVRTLYIDRDPSTFRDVARHLQGYHVKPVDGAHFVKLFADAQFYSLPRLIDQLFESEIFIQIGERHFQIPKDIFSDPGNSPNFFSLGFAVFFSTPSDIFPGLDRRGLIRPPSIVPPNVPGRSAEIFAELLHLLRGYPLHIRNEEHRADLLRDCRYFHLRGLEQRVIAHEISYNLERQKTEICLKLEDVKPSGVSFVSDDPTAGGSPTGGWVNYARPFVDDTSYELIIEIGGESTVLDMNDMRADFHGLAKARVSSLFQVVANKMNLPTNAPLGLMMLSGGQSTQSASPGHTPLSEDRVKVRIDQTTDITLDGDSYEPDWRSIHGRTMLHGPRPGQSEAESESDVMSESTSSKEPSHASSSTGVARTAEVSTQTGPATRSRLTVPPLQTTKLPATKKRKRQGSSADDFGEWIIRSGQWRLRVQNNPQDAIRGGFEIAFLAVKIDAFTVERARNARRGFLS